MIHVFLILTNKFRLKVTEVTPAWSTYTTFHYPHETQRGRPKVFTPTFLPREAESSYNASVYLIWFINKHFNRNIIVDWSKGPSTLLLLSICIQQWGSWKFRVKVDYLTKANISSAAYLAPGNVRLIRDSAAEKKIRFRLQCTRTLEHPNLDGTFSLRSFASKKPSSEVYFNRTLTTQLDLV